MVAFAVSLIWPAAQEWHAPPDDAWYWPIAQSLQAADCATEKRPLLQATQLSALYPLLYLPAAQAEHTYVYDGCGEPASSSRW